MKYLSTRGGMASQPFCDILLEGLAPDGGLTLPETLPKLDAATLESWRGLDYADLAARVLGLFIDDIAPDDLSRMTRAAYAPDVFPRIAPLKPLRPDLSLLGLSEGPTLAFKDMAMQFLGQVFEYVLGKRGATLNILGATSGDTGSAAEYALIIAVVGVGVGAAALALGANVEQAIGNAANEVHDCANAAGPAAGQYNSAGANNCPGAAAAP